MAAMESPNGTPNGSTMSMAQKRKHSEVDSEHINGAVINGDDKAVPPSPPTSPLPSKELNQFFLDLLTILERYAS
jgi:hypothetical protein